MSVMTIPEAWYGQGRMLTVEDTENMPDDEPDRDRPELIVFELRSGAYEQTAHVTGTEEYHTQIPFPVTSRPAQLVSLPG